MYYPSGRMVSYTYNTAGRVNSVPGHVNAVTHHPHGGMNVLTLANGVAETAGYNSRLQMTTLSAKKGLEDRL